MQTVRQKGRHTTERKGVREVQERILPRLPGGKLFAAAVIY
jgi:hypothetical protein